MKTVMYLAGPADFEGEPANGPEIFVHAIKDLLPAFDSIPELIDNLRPEKRTAPRQIIRVTAEVVDADGSVLSVG